MGEPSLSGAAWSFSPYAEPRVFGDRYRLNLALPSATDRKALDLSPASLAASAQPFHLPPPRYMEMTPVSPSPLQLFTPPPCVRNHLRPAFDTAVLNFGALSFSGPLSSGFVIHDGMPSAMVIGGGIQIDASGNFRISLSGQAPGIGGSVGIMTHLPQGNP